MGALSCHLSSYTSLNPTLYASHLRAFSTLRMLASIVSLHPSFLPPDAAIPIQFESAMIECRATFGVCWDQDLWTPQVINAIEQRERKQLEVMQKRQQKEILQAPPLPATRPSASRPHHHHPIPRCKCPPSVHSICVVHSGDRVRAEEARNPPRGRA